MLVGLDTLGSLYVSLVQSNSNSKIMDLFLIELTKQLDQERPHWRKNTVFVWDNVSYSLDLTFLTIFQAPYHTSPATMQSLADRKVPTLF